ncbi:alanine racemase [Paenibacillus abyssi]|uniref:Amino-acid racemase n=1 Tax=Paenibacillus abyssi TaxID=1340531 RepID=A0A917CYB7_9BACL|nr:alanine racemase [Paenibacillus abyssi]GGG02061.1 amino-acid racemase [Paenibacillus abyssi]
MFLETLMNRNKALVNAAVKLHQEGKLEANTYVLDLQTVRENAAIISERAQKSALNVYGMTKQIGYNPDVHQALVESGIKSFVAVDWMGARAIKKQGFKLGHVGHLVQPPAGVEHELAEMLPEVFTVFTMNKARRLNEAAKKIGIKQNILLRVYGQTPLFYPGHEGGFFVGEVVDAAREIMKLSHLQIVGVTSFPCFLFNEQAQDVLPTVNFDAVMEAAARLTKELNIQITQINVPGTNSSDLFEMIAARGGTHVEPGHGLTGTTPLATVRESAEKPALLYLSEVSHMYNGRGHVFGGGLYVDPVRGTYRPRALFGKELNEAEVELIPTGGIDYYGYIDGNVREGDPVVFGFRPQIFVTRGQVAAVDGIREGKPVVLGYYDANGNKI